MIYSIAETTVKKMAEPMNFEISHKIRFEISREDDWPDSLPWPEWKPVTDKTYQPQKMFFSIQWNHGTRPRAGHCHVTVSGHRILKNGCLGAEVRCEYFTLNSLPEPLETYVNKAHMVAINHVESFERRD